MDTPLLAGNDPLTPLLIWSIGPWIPKKEERPQAGCVFICMSFYLLNYAQPTDLQITYVKQPVWPLDVSILQAELILWLFPSFVERTNKHLLKCRSRPQQFIK